MAMNKPHLSFWLIAAAGLAWNLMGCVNYITQTNPENVARMPEIYQVIIAGRPAWATFAFAIAVFGGAIYWDYGKWILAALMACAIGDVFLLSRNSETKFQLGMAAFAAGHILYIVIFKGTLKLHF